MYIPILFFRTWSCRFLLCTYIHPNYLFHLAFKLFQFMLCYWETSSNILNKFNLFQCSDLTLSNLQKLLSITRTYFLTIGQNNFQNKIPIQLTFIKFCFFRIWKSTFLKLRLCPFNAMCFLCVLLMWAL